MRYKGKVYRPPSEAYSLIVQVTYGCSHNGCAFCDMYDDKHFAIRPMEEVREDFEMARRAYKKVERVFLADGDALMRKTEELSQILGLIYGLFPECQRVTCYASPRSLQIKTEEELRQLREGGLKMVYMGLESGCDAVLERMGRAHRADDILRAYALARESGIGCINMDLIAGLPGDSAEGFRASLEQVLDLGPENVTVHTLALKKGSRILLDGLPVPGAAEVGQMLDYSAAHLSQAGYTPYYLYRQKYMSGSFENIGWCRPGTAGLYNIYMMEEMHSIVSLGGGAMTKINLPDGRLERFHNPKFPQQYLERIDDVLAQKDAAFRLL